MVAMVLQAASIVSAGGNAKGAQAEADALLGRQGLQRSHCKLENYLAAGAAALLRTFLIKLRTVSLGCAPLLIQ